VFVSLGRYGVSVFVLQGVCVFGLQGCLCVWAARIFMPLVSNSLCVFVLLGSLSSRAARVFVCLGCKGSLRLWAASGFVSLEC
jgi:hypothetical protein